MATADIKDIYGRKVGSVEINDGSTPYGWGEAPCGPTDSLADHDNGRMKWKVFFGLSFAMMAIPLLVSIAGIFIDMSWLFYSTETNSSSTVAMTSAAGMGLLAISQGAAIAEDLDYWKFTRLGSIGAIILGIFVNADKVISGAVSVSDVVPVFALIVMAIVSYVSFEYCYFTRE